MSCAPHASEARSAGLASLRGQRLLVARRTRRDADEIPLPLRRARRASIEARSPPRRVCRPSAAPRQDRVNVAARRFRSSVASRQSRPPRSRGTRASKSPSWRDLRSTSATDSWHQGRRCGDELPARVHRSASSSSLPVQRLGESPALARQVARHSGALESSQTVRRDGFGCSASPASSSTSPRIVPQSATAVR